MTIMKNALCLLALLTPLAIGCQSDPVAGGASSTGRASSPNLGPALYPVHLVTALDRLVGKTCPDPGTADLDNWGRYTEWLTELREEVDTLRQNYEAERNTDPTAMAPRPFSAYAPYVELQNRASLHAARFNPMSDALRARHDELTRTLGNVK